jgi:hypothetical protein
MTLDEARQELGIDASATSDEARRAYLRGIKIRKPETDPEGFRRLREAYELVSGALSQSQPAPEPPPNDEEEEEPSALAELAARLRGIPGEDQLEERLTLLREGIQEHPESAGVRWWLIEELNEAGRYGELLEAMREAAVDGLPGFLENRALHYPESLGPDDLATLETSGHPAIVAAAAQAHLRGSRLDEAAAALDRAIDRLEEVEPASLRPFPFWLPRGILGLEAAGRAAEARALQERLWEWLSGTGDSDVIERWGEDHPWMVAHELGRLDNDFPPELRKAAAFSALNGETESAAFTAKRLAEDDPGEAELASAMLRDLPILHGLYFDLLHRPAPQQQEKAAPTSQRGRNWSLFKVMAFLLIPLVRLAFSCGDHDVVVHPASEPPGGAQTMTHAEVASLSGDTWGVLARPCERTPPELPRAACDAAVRAVQRVQAGDCGGTQDALDEMMKSALQGLKAPPPAPVAFFQHKMQLILAAGCTPKPPVVPPR